MKDNSEGFSRRTLIAGVVAGVSLPSLSFSQAPALPAGASAPDVLRDPDSATVFTDDKTLRLARSGHRWQAASTAVELMVKGSGAAAEAAVSVEAPDGAVQRVQLRWQGRIPSGWRILGDHWERSYGDLEWRGVVPDRVLPW